MDAIIYSLVVPKVNPWFLLLLSSALSSMRSDELTTPSDESSESLVLYTLPKLGSSPYGSGIYMGVPPHPLFFVSCHMTLVLDFDWVMIFI